MFGLEEGKKKKEAEYLFDLEKEWKDPAKQKQLVQKLEDRMQVIKDIIRKGAKEEELKKLQVVLQGYMSLLKVLAKAIAK